LGEVRVLHGSGVFLSGAVGRDGGRDLTISLKFMNEFRQVITLSFSN